METYLALLRGINVGGRNPIKMSDLVVVFEHMGFIKVRTYIQSGNVIFCGPKISQAQLAGELDAALSKRFDEYASHVVVRSHKAMKEVISMAPEGFGSEPEKYRYDVVYLREPLTAAQAGKFVSLREGVDRAWPGKGVLYFAKLISRATQSFLPRIIAAPVYQDMTIRNWNTTRKLLEMMEAVGR